MPDFLDQPTGKEDFDQFKIYVGRLYETFDWLINTLSINKVLNLDGTTIYDGSVQNAHIVDVDGQKLLQYTVDGQTKLVSLSVDNAKIASGLDGAKMLALSVLNGVIGNMDGVKLFDLSVPWDNMRNTRSSGDRPFTVDPGAPDIPQILDIPITHATVYAQNTNPMIRINTNGTYMCPFDYVAEPNFSNLVGFKILKSTETGFTIRISNTSTSAQTAVIYWYRDGIYL